MFFQIECKIYSKGFSYLMLQQNPFLYKKPCLHQGDDILEDFFF